MVVIAAIAVVAILGVYVLSQGTGVSGQFVNPFQAAPAGGAAAAAQCGSTITTVVTFTLSNIENTTADTFDATGYLFGANGDYQTIVATTADAKNLNCGETYTLKLISSDGAGGDSSLIKSLALGSIATAQVTGGNAVFTPTGAYASLNMQGSKHGVLEARMFSIDENAYIFDTGDASATNWEATGAVFESATDNATNTTIDTSGEANVQLLYRASATALDFSDRGYWILLDLPTTEYDIPACSLDGVALVDQKGSMTAYEARAYSGYEYAFKIASGNKVLNTPYHTLTCGLRALSGINPSSDPIISLASVGTYLSSDGVTLKEGAVKDDASTTAVYTIQSYTLYVT